MSKAVKSLVLIALFLVVSFGQERLRFGTVDRVRYVTAWNDIEDAVERINATRTELGENIRTFAPWHVISEPKQIRRRELYKAAASDAELIAKRYREMEELEK